MKQRLLLLSFYIFFSISFRGESRIDIQMQEIGGVYQIPCKVNGVSMNFIFDTGASNVCISLSEALYLHKNRYINSSDIGGVVRSQVADGSIVENTHLNIRKLEVGGLILNNVDALVVSSLNAPLLLGQSAIQRLGRVEINGDRLTIVSSNSSQPYRSDSKGGILTKIKDWWNDGWHYEGEIKTHRKFTFKLYSREVGGQTEYQVEDYRKQKFPVRINQTFGIEKTRGREGRMIKNELYKYKYLINNDAFNIPGNNVDIELKAIKIRQWNFIGIVLVDRPKIRDGIIKLERKGANLYWREYDDKYKIVICERTRGSDEFMEDNKFKYPEPESPREIIATKRPHYQYYHYRERIEYGDDGDFSIQRRNIDDSWFYEYEAGEFSFNLP